VTRGSAVARELGFHTANIDTQGCLVPPDGIYAALVRFDADELPAALYIGTSPTIKDNREQTVEVHILDYQGELYGRQLEVVILKKLRDERKFPDRESLKRQIAEDIEQTRRMTENGEGAA
jgi:riboflavin kinase/FMN adenylyltransferase